MKVVAIIPVREFRETKLRLSKFLNASKRAQLTRAFLNHVLQALQGSNIEAVIIVASNKREATRIASAYPKVLVMGEHTHKGGVNKAMEDGIEFARNNFRSLNSAMLIPSDLPFLSPEVLNATISGLERYDLVLAPSGKRDGTNLILFNISKGDIALHYDDNSYRKHLAEARRRKIRFKICLSKEFLFDVDSPGDLRKLMKELRAHTFQELTHKLNQAQDR